MEYLFLGVIGWIVLCSPALIFAAVANGRRRRQNEELSQRITSLTKQLEGLEHRLDAAGKAAQVSPQPVGPRAATLPGTGIGGAAQPPPANISARVQTPTTAPLHRSAVAAPVPAASKKAASEGLEEKIGLKWFARIGITIVVLGIALLIASKWTAIPLVVRVLLIYAGSLGILGLGIFAERYENYRVLGRSLIGGGWAAIFLTTYAIGNVQSLFVLSSPTVDLFLLLAVAAVMVWHTLKYDSQAVTGIAFLLGFASVTLNPV